MEARLKRQEKMVSEKMAERLRNVKAEQAQLARIQQELEGMQQMTQQDVHIIRAKIENTERELFAATKLHTQKKKEYEDSKAAMEKKQKQKELLTEHLRMIIYENEKKKEEKLALLMDKLGVSREEASGFKGFDESKK